MRKSKKIVLISLSALLFACTNNDSTKANSKSSNTIETIENSIPKEVIEINLIAKGEDMNEIAFEPNVLTIASNTRIKLSLKNESTAAGMLHNFVLVELGSGKEISAKGLRAGKAKGFIPKDKRVIAYTKISNIGETVTVEFDAPAKGSYHYICTYPGHISMVGRLNVE